MEKKIIKQDLVEGLVARRKISKKKAEAFVHAVFDIIEEGLLADHLVKVKGIGTFKLITVDSRESVNVNTGERITIESHAKISFTPDPVLRDHVNRPFADFETVILNDETKTEDMEHIDEPETAIEEQPVVETVEEPVVKVEEPVVEVAKEEVVTETEPVVEEIVKPTVERVVEPVAEKVVKPVVEKKEEPVAEVKEEPVVKVEEPVVRQEEKTEGPVAVKPAEGGGERKNYWWMILLLVIGICLLAFFIGRRTGVSETPQPLPQDVEISENTDTIVADEPVPEPVPEPEINIEECKEKYPQVKYGEYWIVGTKATHTIQKGDDLSKLALEHYGDKKVISYIIKYNGLKNPSNILVGQEIKLPELTPRKKTTDTINQ